MYTMCAERDIAADEEVRMSYGDLADAELLVTYGFVDTPAEGPPNPHDFVAVPTALIMKHCIAHTRQQELGAQRVQDLTSVRKPFLEARGILGPNPDGFRLARTAPDYDRLLTIVQACLFLEVENNDAHCSQCLRSGQEMQVLLLQDNLEWAEAKVQI